MNEEAGQFYDYRDVNSNLTGNYPTNYPMGENTGHHHPHDHKQIKDLCEKHINYYVMGHLKDGRVIEGIILSVDHEAVTILVAEKDNHKREEEDTRQFGRFPGFARFSPFRVPFPLFGFPFITPFWFPFWV
ncbi:MULTISPECIES: hypothetical protein [unclassified Sporolactobacillus]|uniref:hypothetical protein n=1 Tax=unclassified Sporolactobacillus TaxID=2628533 RepID=UPI0023674302|nr:hypothetical protein [Sporolactobacillus sp. CQH2019]MDD9147723.1 hypothetical protein [Sporolactobacillus sp. CQH2019]